MASQSILLAEIILVTKSRTKVFPDKQFLQNDSQEFYLKKKSFPEKHNDKTFQEILKNQSVPFWNASQTLHENLHATNKSGCHFYS